MIEAVEIATRDGTVLRGEFRARGPDVAICIHAQGGDLDIWQQVALELADDDLSVLSYDLPGHGGSDGLPSQERAIRDLEEVLSYAKTRCSGRSFLLADGDASQAALSLATERELAGLVLLSPAALVGLEREPAIPKLLVLGADCAFDEQMALSNGQLIGYSLVVRLPVRGSLLAGPWGATVVGYVVRFLREARLRSPMEGVRE